MALLVTGVSAVSMLLGAVLLYNAYGTFSLPELFERAESGPTTTAACVLIAVAALAKSAQVPLHFWLPRAMAAPTPVSAYLHSAAMVAAGVLVLGRVHPLLAKSDLVLDVLLVVGLVSIAVGGVLALAQDELKQILAHSTISQYGYVVALYGIGGATAAGAAALYVLAHAIAKSALFMTAGAVTVATGESRLSRLGGLGRRLPALAVASGIAAATLAALPLTLGFFKDELFFSAASEHGRLVQVLAVVAAALTFAYIGRFWLGIFAGPRGQGPAGGFRRSCSRPSRCSPCWPSSAASSSSRSHGWRRTRRRSRTAGVVDVAPAYHLDTGTENVMALAAWALGALVLLTPRVRDPVVRAFGRIGQIAGPRRWYGLSLLGLNRLSDWAHDTEVRDLRNSIAAVLVPAAALIALGVRRHADPRVLRRRAGRSPGPSDRRPARSRRARGGDGSARPGPAAARPRALGARLRAGGRLRDGRRARRRARGRPGRDRPHPRLRRRLLAAAADDRCAVHGGAPRNAGIGVVGRRGRVRDDLGVRCPARRRPPASQPSTSTGRLTHTAATS